MRAGNALLIVGLLLLLSAPLALAENIDPYNDGSQYAYGQNVGWLNAEPLGGGGPGVEVEDYKLTGYIWGQNIGWISMSCENTSSCATVDYGVANDGTGLLSGYAWAQNVGWINFNPTVAGDPNSYGITIDSEGNFDGWAWGQNIGWIHCASASPVAYKVQTSWATSCQVAFDDLSRFARDWLKSGVLGDLDGSGKADFVDYVWLAHFWLCNCPVPWPLK